MINIRRSKDRGAANHGWLDSKHTFSFANYHDPNHMGFGALRVINEDKVDLGSGFDTHGHRDMEIISYVIEGSLKHKDSMGKVSVIKPGEIQRMTAGTGIRHSEYNNSAIEPVRFLQIWILPERNGLQPGYEQKAFSDAERLNELKLVGSRRGRDGSIVIHQDVNLYATQLEHNEKVDHDLKPGRRAWLQLISGDITINGKKLNSGDGAAIVEEAKFEIIAYTSSEFILFDLF